MINPFKFRPNEAFEDEPAPDEWADNWLSNFIAWAALTFVGPWCSTETHWTSRVTNYLFTSCPCCLLFRGLAIGAISGYVLATIVYMTVL